MGFLFQKSFGFGLVRLNVSRSEFGLSWWTSLWNSVV
jgi:hypothetical protein